jgi:hypothetical protein
VGKSYLLNKLFNCEFESNASAERVTTKQAKEIVYDKFQRRKITVIDSVGYDGDPRNLLDLDEYEGKSICLLYLNADLRFESSLQKISEKYRIDVADINVYNSIMFTPPLRTSLVPRYEQIKRDCKNRSLKILKLSRRIPYVGESLLSAFQPFPLFLHDESELRGCFVKMYFCGELDENFGTFQDSGKCLLEYFRSRGDVVRKWMLSNKKKKSFLMTKLTIPESFLKEIIADVYGENTFLCVTCYAGIFEAYFYYVFSKRRLYFLTLLNMYVGYMHSSRNGM